VRWKTFENLTFPPASPGRYDASIVVKWRCPETRQAAILAANLPRHPQFEVTMKEAVRIAVVTAACFLIATVFA
jgi:hypothetical protein